MVTLVYQLQLRIRFQFKSDYSLLLPMDQFNTALELAQKRAESDQALFKLIVEKRLDQNGDTIEKSFELQFVFPF